MSGRRQIDQEELRIMFEVEKLSDQSIGQRIGLSTESAQRLRLRRGFVREVHPNGRNKMPADLLKECEKMIDEGYHFASISQMKNVAEKTLRRHFPGRAFTSQQVAELSSMRLKLGRVKIK